MEQELTELKEEIDSSTIILGDFNTLHTVMDRITRQKISKEIKNLKNATDPLDLTDVYRTLYLTTIEYIFFTSAHVTFSRIDDMLGHK